MLFINIKNINIYNENKQMICKDDLKNYNNENIFFVVDNTVLGEFIIVVTDSVFVQSRTKVISLRMFTLFSIISTVCIFIIGVWGNSLVSRIKRLQEQNN